MPFRPLQSFNNLLGRMAPTENYGGLLSPADQRAAGRDMRMMLASGLLSAAGPQRTPVSLGQAIGAALPPAMAARDQRAEAGLRNDQLRRQIERENNEAAAQAELETVLTGLGGEEGEIWGLLGKIAPREAAAGLLGKVLGQSERSDPAAIREMQMLGYPLTADGFAQYNAAKTQGQGGDLAAQLLIDERQARLEREKRESEQTQVDRARTRTTLQNTVRRSIDQTAKIADLTQGLEGSFLEAGMPASAWRRTGAGMLAGVGQALGMDTSKLEGDLSKFDQLKKNLSDQLINLMSTGGLGEATNSKLEQYQNALASTETSPPAILAIQANIAELLLDEADAQGFEVPNREKVESNIEAWRSYESGADDTPVLRAADIGRMSAEQLQALPAAQMTPEMLEAAAERWDELNAR